MNFDQSFTRLLGHEGGYSDNPTDPGGKTMWGVTERVARAAGYIGEMRDLPQSFAKQRVYRPGYWDSVRADELPENVRFDVFDSAVNSGVRTAIMWLQASAGVAVDGALGPVTLAAVNAAGPMAAARFNGARLDAMTNMSGWPTFSRGWARRVAANLMQMGA